MGFFDIFRKKKKIDILKIEKLNNSELDSPNHETKSNQVNTNNINTEEIYSNLGIDLANKLNPELVWKGIHLEREGKSDEAISAYKESIKTRTTAKHPYERLVILYRRKKDYENEIRVIQQAIDVYMIENTRRANLVIQKDESLYGDVMAALETNESFKYDDGRWAFVQYDVK